MVVFSRKCLTFQAQQDVIDILNSIKCGPQTYNPFFFSLTVHVYLTGSQGNGNEPSVMLRWHSGFPNHNSLVTAHSQPTISRKACHCPGRTKTKQPDLSLLQYFCTPHSFNRCCSTSQHWCQVTGTSRGMEQVPGLRWNNSSGIHVLRLVFQVMCVHDEEEEKWARAILPVFVRSFVCKAFIANLFCDRSASEEQEQRYQGCSESY